MILAELEDERRWDEAFARSPNSAYCAGMVAKYEPELT
jgi:hypothetical protein